MRLLHNAPLALGAILVSLALPGAASAQGVAGWDDTTCRVEVSDPATLGSDPSLENPPRKGLKVNAKIDFVSGDRIIVFGNQDVPFVLYKSLVQADIIGALGLKDKDNIVAYGYLTPLPPAPGKYFMVMNLLKGDEDQKRFRAQIAELEKAGNAAGLFKLADQIEKMGVVVKQPAAYKPVARDAYRAGIALKEKAVKPDDAAAWIALASDYLKLLADRQGALERLKNAIRPGEPLTPEVSSMLKQLSATSYGGEYLLSEEMKKREGFVERGPGNWVRKEQAEFEDLIDAQRKSPVRTRNKGFLPGYFQKAAEDHSILLGMNKEELALSIGFPDDLDRQRRGPDTYDMWVYEGRGTFYFENGELFRKPDAPK